MVIFGVDPGSKTHALAVYRDGVLTDLMTLETLKLAQLAKNYGAVCSVEHVAANKFVYHRNTHKSKDAQSKIAIDVGRCLQAQVELCRLFDAFGVPYQLVVPQRGNWAENKAMFERITGWSGRSNKDTRSAAFFGYMLVK